MPEVLQNKGDTLDTLEENIFLQLENTPEPVNLKLIQILHLL